MSEGTPELFYGLNEGERVMIRRALAMYGQHFLAEQRKHLAAKDSYNADMDKARIAAADKLADKILKGGKRA